MFFDTIAAINKVVNDFVWGVPAMVCIIGVGLLLSVRTGFLQIRKFPFALKTTIGRMFHKKEAADGAMTPFQAVCTALAGTVGTGNIAGVAGAIAIGGPGAVFWMWCSALLGMCTKFSEVTLAVHFRERNANGELVGGPMYYIKNGLAKHWRWLAAIYALFGVLTVFGTGNATQVNTIVTAIDSALLAYGISLACGIAPTRFALSAVPALGILPFQALKIAVALGLTGPLLRQTTKLITNVYKLFTALDCSLVEINPLVVTTDDRVCALDAKFNFDDNALYRHPEIMEMRDETEEDPREVEAGKYDLNYIGLDGNIGCMVNGAGLAMATMDIIKYYGGEPANFLDVGGSATEEMVTNAFRILTSDKNVKALLVNIFGGIMRCDVIAQGIVAAAKNIDMKIPLVVRLEGTNVEIGKKILADSGISIIPADNLDEAAQKAVAAVK